MSLTARLLAGFVALALAGFFLIYRPILDRVERQYLEAAEEPMVDAAEILAGILSQELAVTGRLPDSLGPGLLTASGRTLDATIYDIRKRTVAMDLYVTDERGVVRFDSGHPERVGLDFSLFYDVSRTLAGAYGARSTRENEDDQRSSIMYVGAPLIVDGRIVGVVSVYKPQSALHAFIEETRTRLQLLALAGITGFLLVGFLLSRWVTEPIARLTRHAEAVTRGERSPPPRLPGRQLRVLGDALERMRDALEDRNYVATYVQTLTHEMKSPVAAISGAAEILAEPNLSAPRRGQFLAHLRGEAARLQSLIEQLLALSSLETWKRLEDPQPLDLAELTARIVTDFRARGLGVDVHARPAPVCGDEFLLETAIRNLLQNAADFSPPGAAISVDVGAADGHAVLHVRDRGPGLPDYAVPRAFDRFYSLPRPATGRKSSGLGLCFVRETASLHGGQATLENRSDPPGAEATLRLPLA